MRALAFVLAVLSATSCAHAPVLALEGGWQSPLARDNPLVGRVWDVKHHRFADEHALVSSLQQADFALLGETHDNVDDHRLEARFVDAIARGKRALAFEMLSTDQQAAVDTALAAHPGNPDAIASAVDWMHSGWPAFELYRPVFAAGLAHHLKIVAADLSDAGARAVVYRGRAALGAIENALLSPLPKAIEDDWQHEMEAAHCGALPDRFLAPMVLAQRARDLSLATSLVHAASNDGAILVTGAGHARTDRGVPALLAKLAPGRRAVAVAFLEVKPVETKAEAYGELPWDFVVFTPAASREDPCRIFRQHPPH